ncbi:MAG: Uma2 family endonuclease [Gemmataceae bacterium]|nr:Uma2 family endonuclease [Gemmataceae bacterium]
MTPTHAPPAEPGLMTLDEFAAKHGWDHVELIDGKVVQLPMAFPKHGRVCTKAAEVLNAFVEAGDLGVVCSNDSFVVVRQSPPRVRGADVAYWPKAKLPGGVLPDGFVYTPPDLCVEVVSPSNTWTEIHTKTTEYHAAGVPVVVVLDPDTKTATAYRKLNGHGDDGGQVFPVDIDLTLPDILPGFAVPVRKFFE